METFMYKGKRMTVKKYHIFKAGLDFTSPLGPVGFPCRNVNIREKQNLHNDSNHLMFESSIGQIYLSHYTNNGNGNRDTSWNL